MHLFSIASVATVTSLTGICILTHLLAVRILPTEMSIETERSSFERSMHQLEVRHPQREHTLFNLGFVNKDQRKYLTSWKILTCVQALRNGSCSVRKIIL